MYIFGVGSFNPLAIYVSNWIISPNSDKHGHIHYSNIYLRPPVRSWSFPKTNIFAAAKWWQKGDNPFPFLTRPIFIGGYLSVGEGSISSWRLQPI